MGQYTIRMPDIGEGIAEVELVKWRVAPGEAVAEDQVLADVMTDKATVEIPSPVAGTVKSLGGEPGQRMAVGAELIRLEVEGAGNAARAPVAAPALAATAAVVTAPAPPPPLASPAPTRTPDERAIASPAVRRRAWELNIDLQYVHGSGPAGRITQADLDVYLASRGGQPATTTSAPPAGRVREATPAPPANEGEQQVPIIGLRRRIAQKMQEAKRRIPHFTYVEEIDVTEAEALRQQLNARYGEERGKLTLLPFIARAILDSLADFPQMNARFDDEAGIVTRHAPVHLGIATQTDSGLLVPVLRHAETQDLWGLAREIARLAETARSGRITREELSGSTITLTSLGALGGIVSTPVINHPEVAIVGVNRMVERPVFRHGTVVGRQLMNLSSSFDHRVVDGMDAARFIQAVRALLEQPALLFVR
ncbi:2-oxo acid dehydrogenase subunit E2 [Ramlibacter sp. G-1-2-2]|uniref:Dihydrolipoamide acetyltransferase component of pyruvate dehydrogenase complex n=1 Tax=Ramlibacter agri TaxID=2728837 RepID=A0A848HH63_9BURK|nr:dihydrolipoamide acetyltransferase family protein [Ramlibacter agri]NML47008.1 2-oxo acid dehydrogenase subunit E2 [Ramlibacter agri]